MKYLMTQSGKCGVCLLISTLFIAIFYQPVFAHAGVDHSKNCFLTVGDTRLQISGYQFQPELEGKASAPARAPYLSPVAKHFCHFFPELGQIVIKVEPIDKGQDKTLVSLELEELTSLVNPAQAFTVIKQQPEQLMGAGLASMQQTIQQLGIYRLTVTLQKPSGIRQQQSFVFLVGIPVTKILVMIALVLVLVIVLFGMQSFNKRVATV